MTKSRKKPNSAFLNLAAMVLGALLGILFGETMCSFKFIGDIWLNCIKMILVPLVTCMVVTAIGSQKDLRTLGRIALRIMIYYVITTVIAILIGLGVTYAFKPGLSFNAAGLSSSQVEAGGGLTAESFFTNLFSSNMFKTYADADILPTMVIAIFIGIAILRMKNQEHKETVLHWFESINSLISEYLRMIIGLAPIGVVFLMADSFGKYGVTIFTSMAQLLGTYWFGLLLQVLFVYGGSLLLFARMNPLRFLKDASPVWTFTIATCSSTANIPNSLKTAKEVFHVPDSIANFCIPLGANMNCDGLSMTFACVIVFIGQMNGIQYDLPTLLRIILVATLLSSAGSGIPGGGIVKLMTIVGTFGLPSEIVGIMAGFYRFFDMGTTTCNCLGDLVGTVCITKMEEKRAKRLGTEMIQ